jgi:dUTP pyrophosphatase
MVDRTKKMNIKVIKKSKHKLPSYSALFSIRRDLRKNIKDELALVQNRSELVPTKLYNEIIIGYESQTRPGSGLAMKFRIKVINPPGTIGSDYRGEISKILVNPSNENYIIKD